MSGAAIVRSIRIHTPASRVMTLITQLTEWRKWSPFEPEEGDVVREYRGSGQGAGAIYEWKGDKGAAEGVITITDAKETRVTVHLRFIRPYASDSEHVFDVLPEGDWTEVVWTVDQRRKGVGGFIDRFLLPPEDEVLQREFDRGLRALKAAAEDSSAVPE